MSLIVWNDTHLEKKMFEALMKDLGSQADPYIIDYKDARNKLIENILPEIKRIEQGLTDHSEKHIMNVLNNAYYLLGNGETILNSFELYLLCVSILFHDVGNIHGRAGHFKIETIQKIYEFVRDTSKNVRFKSEKVIISNIASVHSGLSKRNKNNPEDTIYDLSFQSVNNFQNTPINLKEIAAILRFADELAEGAQRTSTYILQKGLINDKNSVLHHLNSYSFTSNISRQSGRIAITYHIPINTKNSHNLIFKELKELLEFTYKRITKINRERIYCKHYSLSLAPFTHISVQYYFSINEIEESFDIDALELSDLTFESKKIPEINSLYELKNIVQMIRKHLTLPK